MEIDRFSADAEIPRPRKHVTSACHACKTGKVKCDGNQPCARCASKDTICTYRTDEDGRSRVPTKRKIEQLQHDNNLLHGLFDELRGGDDIQVRRVVSLIRSNTSISDIHNSLSPLTQSTRSTQRPGSPTLEESNLAFEAAPFWSPSSGGLSPRSQTSETPSRVLSVHRLVDDPTYRVPAAPWTTVTSDDQLVSHLLSLWATWDHLFPDGIFLQLFLRDMRSANTNSYFCSPFLVSCILAAGCLHSDYDEAKTNQGAPSDLANQFIKEAKAHFERDPLTPSITNVQALTLLYMTVSKMSRDRDGYYYAIQAATLGSELSRARDRIVKSASGSEAQEEIGLALDVTCWGAFSCTAGSMMCLERPHTSEPPKRPFPNVASIRTAYRTIDWSPYPRRDGGRPIHLNEMLYHHASLGLLTSELTRMIFIDHQNSVSSERIQRLDDFHVRLEIWQARVSEQIEQLPADCPAMITLYLWWHGVVLTLLRAKVQTRPLTHQYEANGHDFEIVADESRSKDTAHRETGSHRNQQITQALAVSRLAGLHRTSYGYSRLNCVICHPIHLALYVLLENNDNRSYDSDITELCTAIYSASRRIPFAFSLFRMIQIDVRQRALELPSEVARILENFETNNITNRTSREVPNSMYPCPSPLQGQYHILLDQEEAEAQPTNMGEFLQMFDELIVEDE